MFSRRIRTRSGVASSVFVLAILALAIPPLVAAANITVNAIPGAGWIQSPDNTGSLSAVIVASPVADLGVDSVKLATTAATTDTVGIARPLLSPLSDLTGGSWRTFVTGSSGQINSEPAALRFAIFRNGVTQFTSMVVERVYSATVSPNVWQTDTLSASTVVWQTSNSDSFCTSTLFCTFAEFKAHYPDANITGLTVGIGSGIPVTTSYFDGVSVTVGGTTNTWDFELAAAPSPSPSPSPSPVPSASASAPASTPPSAAPTAVPSNPPGPATDVATPPSDSSTMFGPVFAILAIVGLVALLSVRLRRARPTD